MELSQEDEWQLIQQAQAGDGQAYEKLIRAHRARIQGMARTFAWRNPEWKDDLTQEGMIGFMAAVESFDSTKNVRLWTHAYWNVKRWMITWLGQQRHLSKDARDNYSRIVRTWKMLWQEQEQAPTPEEVADRLFIDLEIEIKPEIIREVLQGIDVPLQDESDYIDDDDEAWRTPGSVPRDEHTPEEIIEREQDRSVDDEPLFQEVRNRLEHSWRKWLILYYLVEKDVQREPTSYTWEVLAAYLKNPYANIASEWQNLCERQRPPQELPREWASVVHLFAGGRPALTSEAMKQFYSRGWAKLKRHIT